MNFSFGCGELPSTQTMPPRRVTQRVTSKRLPGVDECRKRDRGLTRAVTWSAATVVDDTVSTTERVILMNYYLQAALACERRKTLLAEAEAFRRARQARNHQPAARHAGRAIRRWRPRWGLVHRAMASTGWAHSRAGSGS
jgi:hypothetical protein